MSVNAKRYLAAALAGLVGTGVFFLLTQNLSTSARATAFLFVFLLGLTLLAVLGLLRTKK